MCVWLWETQKRYVFSCPVFCGLLRVSARKCRAKSFNSQKVIQVDPCATSNPKAPQSTDNWKINLLEYFICNDQLHLNKKSLNS